MPTQSLPKSFSLYVLHVHPLFYSFLPWHTGIFEFYHYCTAKIPKLTDTHAISGDYNKLQKKNFTWVSQTKLNPHPLSEDKSRSAEQMDDMINTLWTKVHVGKHNSCNKYNTITLIIAAQSLMGIQFFLWMMVTAILPPLLA